MMTVAPPSRSIRYLTVFLRWIMVAFGVFALTVLAGSYLINSVFTRVYTATAEMQVKASRTGGSPGKVADGNPLSSDDFASDLAVFRSNDFLLAVVNDLSLDKTWSKRSLKAPGDALSPNEAVARLQKRLEFKLIEGTDIIGVTASSDEGQEAADIANAVVEQYKALRDAEEGQINDQEGASMQQQSPVRIVSRAVVPTAPSSPDKKLDFIITLGAGLFLGIMAASFAEVILLLARASERFES
jgi:uncharacterized protein involved in exopolysaccharide biosynthesis